MLQRKKDYGIINYRNTVQKSQDNKHATQKKKTKKNKNKQSQRDTQKQMESYKIIQREEENHIHTMTKIKHILLLIADSGSRVSQEGNRPGTVVMLSILGDKVRIMWDKHLS